MTYRTHKGDPCIYCGIPHDCVEIGDCPGTPGISETAVLRKFYDEVCREAELRMEKTGRLEGAHYAAMRSVLKSKGIET